MIGTNPNNTVLTNRASSNSKQRFQTKRYSNGGDLTKNLDETLAAIQAKEDKEKINKLTRQLSQYRAQAKKLEEQLKSLQEKS